jgi:hypothetical protein
MHTLEDMLWIISRLGLVKYPQHTVVVTGLKIFFYSFFASRWSMGHP